MSPQPTPHVSASDSAALPAPPCIAPQADATQWFNQEVHPHDGQLKNYLRGTFRLRDVDDVVQESYLRIWKARAAHPIESAKAFLFQIARHLALDTIRKDSRAPLDFAEDSAVSRVLDTAPDAAEALVTKETLQHLADAVLSLPAHYRDVIYYHKIKGLPQKEVAAKLDLSERSVEKYLSRGMEKVATYLRRRGIHDPVG